MKPNDSSLSAGADSRRNFLKKTAVATATVASLKTPVYGQNQAPSANVQGANSRLIIGHIGVGGQGMRHVRDVKKFSKENNTVQVATCDVWQKRKDSSKAYIEQDNPGVKVRAYDDHRKLLENKDLDAVFIATVDHWHTTCAVDAMNAGLHVYVEKPMTRYLDEAFEIHDTAKRTGKKVQVGAQGSSDAKWHKAAEIISGGGIGPLVLGQGSYMRNAAAKGGEWNYKIDPDARKDNLDWNRWLGPVNRKVDFNPDHYFRWRKYFPYCAGLLGDLIPHRLHPLVIASGKPEFPSRVACIGTRKISTDRDVPDNTQILVEFPSGYCLLLTSATVNEQGLPDMIRGYKATLTMGGNRIDLNPERPFADEIDPEKFDNLQPGESVPVHEKNFFDSIRANKEPNANIDLAIRVQTIISLAEMSERLNIVCLFDEKTRQISTGEGTVMKPISYGTLPLS